MACYVEDYLKGTGLPGIADPTQPLEVSFAIEEATEAKQPLLLCTINWEQRESLQMLESLGFVASGWAKRKRREYSAKVNVLVLDLKYPCKGTIGIGGGVHTCCAAYGLGLYADPANQRVQLEEVLLGTIVAIENNKSLMIAALSPKTMYLKPVLDLVGYKCLLSREDVEIWVLRVNSDDYNRKLAPALFGVIGDKHLPDYGLRIDPELRKNLFAEGLLSTFIREYLEQSEIRVAIPLVCVDHALNWSLTEDPQLWEDFYVTYK